MGRSATPARDSVVRLRDGRALSVAEWGPDDGQPVFLFHGNPGSRLACPDDEATDAARVRLIVPDRPGYGGSDPKPGRTLLDWAADTAAIADELGLETFSIAGVSGGGPFAMACAVALGERVRSIALVASDGPESEIPEAEAIVTERGWQLRRALRADAAAARPAVLERFDDFAQDPQSVLAFADEMIRSTPVDALPSDLREMSRPEVRAAYAATFEEGARQGAAGLADDGIAMLLPWGFLPADIDRPTSIWWGEEDGMTGRFHTDYLASHIPNARVHIVPGVGHGIADRCWAEILGELA